MWQAGVGRGRDDFKLTEEERRCELSSNQDRILTCEDCGAEFKWSAGEQDYYDYKGFASPPKRCKRCREARKERKQRRHGKG